MATFDEEIDRTIDDVAREMTAGDPPGAFRARVLARIETYQHERDLRTQHHQGRPAVAGFRWTIAVVAALIVIAAGTAALMIRHSGIRLKPDATNTGATAIATGTPTATAAATDTRTETQTVPPAKSAARSHKTARTRGTTRYFSEVAALAPPPLEMEPIAEVESIALGALAPPPRLDVPELEPIAPIALASIGEGDRP